MGEDKTKRINCASCNKPLKIVKRYYRNGKYFCTKNCYKTFLKKQEKKADEQPA